MLIENIRVAPQWDKMISFIHILSNVFLAQVHTVNENIANAWECLPTIKSKNIHRHTYSCMMIIAVKDTDLHSLVHPAVCFWSLPHKGGLCLWPTSFRCWEFLECFKFSTENVSDFYSNPGQSGHFTHEGRVETGVVWGGVHIKT